MYKTEKSSRFIWWYIEEDTSDIQSFEKTVCTLYMYHHLYAATQIKFFYASLKNVLKRYDFVEKKIKDT